MTLKSYIGCQFGELKREMLYVLTGLRQHDLRLKSKVSPHPVGWLVQHCMSVIDWAVVRHMTGTQFYSYPAGLSKYPMDAPSKSYTMPTPLELQNRWRALLEHLLMHLSALGEQELQETSATGIEPLAESCLRAINHTNTHLRGIWSILTHYGRLCKWPTQPMWMPDPTIEELRRELHKGLRTVGNSQSPLARRLAHRFAPRILHQDNRAVLECCEDLLESGDTWQHMIACAWIEMLQERLQADAFHTFERWLNQYVFSWGTCDDFCKRALNPMIERYPSLTSRLKEWTESPNKWVRRASAVSFIRSENGSSAVRLPTRDVFAIARCLLKDPDVHVQKGLGWLLKSTSVHNRDEVYRFLVQERGSLSRTAFRYALQKMPKSLRAKAMLLI
jgi:3-methyladenine DNA glycosylase AlkD